MILFMLVSDSFCGRLDQERAVCGIPHYFRFFEFYNHGLVLQASQAMLPCKF